MTLIEFIGFIITMIAFFLLIWKRARDERRARDHPEEFEEEIGGQQAQLEEILKSLDLYVERDEKSPPPPKIDYPGVERDREFIEQKRIEPKAKAIRKKELFRDVHALKRKAVHETPYQREEDIPSRATRALKEVGSLQDAVVLAEILGPPKSVPKRDAHF